MATAKPISDRMMMMMMMMMMMIRMMMMMIRIRNNKGRSLRTKTRDSATRPGAATVYTIAEVQDRPPNPSWSKQTPPIEGQEVLLGIQQVSAHNGLAQHPKPIWTHEEQEQHVASMAIMLSPWDLQAKTWKACKRPNESVQYISERFLSCLGCRVLLLRKGRS